MDMAADIGWFSVVGQIFRDLQTVASFLFFFGLVCLLTGIVAGPFHISNPKIAWGTVIVLASFAWRYLATARDLYFTDKVRVEWHPERIILGALFGAASVAGAYWASNYSH